MYEYNPQGIAKHVRNKTFSQRQLTDLTKVSMPTVIRWVKGEDLHISKLIKICNQFKIPLGDFITENGEPVSSIFTNDPSQTRAIHNLPPGESSGLVEVMKYEEQIKKIKLDFEDKIYRMEREFLERMGDVREASAEKWSKKNMEAIQAERKQLETKYEKRLKEQNDEIIRLREENAVLRSQVKAKTAKTYAPAEILSEQDSHVAKP